LHIIITLLCNYVNAAKERTMSTRSALVTFIIYILLKIKQKNKNKSTRQKSYLKKHFRPKQGFEWNIGLETHDIIKIIYK